METEKNKLNAFIQQLATKNLLQAQQLQKQLTAMQGNYAKALKLLQAIRTLQKNLTNNKENKKDLLWLAAMEATTLEKINANGLLQQEILALKIEQLKKVAINS